MVLVLQKEAEKMLNTGSQNLISFEIVLKLINFHTSIVLNLWTFLFLRVKVMRKLENLIYLFFKIHKINMRTFQREVVMLSIPLKITFQQEVR